MIYGSLFVSDCDHGKGGIANVYRRLAVQPLEHSSLEGGHVSLREVDGSVRRALRSICVPNSAVGFANHTVAMPKQKRFALVGCNTIVMISLGFEQLAEYLISCRVAYEIYEK